MSEKKENDESLEIREYEGTTVEEAMKKALAELNLPKERIKIQILTEGQKGLFGMEGAKKAKIRVRVLPEKKEPK